MTSGWIDATAYFLKSFSIFAFVDSFSLFPVFGLIATYTLPYTGGDSFSPP